MDNSFVSDVCLNDVSDLQLQDTVAYRQRVEFSNADDYAVYVRENISVGMKVRCCQTYEEVCEGDMGTVVKVSDVAVVVVIMFCVVLCTEVVHSHKHTQGRLQERSVNCAVR